MDIYVVDTNIVFSAAMHPSRSIGRFFLLAKKYGVKFYAPEFLQEEIERHFPKLVELTKLPPNTVREQLMLFYRCIQFIPDREIPLKYFAQAAAYVREVDEDDTIFVALTEFFGERLWTGDRKLFISLISKGYKNAVEFRDIKLDYPDAV